MVRVMSNNQKTLQVGLLVFAVVMTMCSLVNGYAIYQRDTGIARLQVRIDALEARLNTLARKGTALTRTE